jgi:hypothetical protein
MSDDLVKRLRDLGDYDEGKANEARIEAADRIEQLEAALRDIMEDGVEREVGTYFRADNTPSKHDECKHGLAMYETCGNCISEFARKALEGKDD